ncbi:MAG: ATP-binding protein [Pseudomonadota bacterium]
MLEFLKNQIDFLLALSGLVYVMFAAVFLLLKRRERRGTQWASLGIFAVLQGLGNWTKLLEMSLGGSVLLQAFWFLSMGLSFVSLAAFGRDLIVSKRVGISEWGVLVFFLPVCALGSMVGLNVDFAFEGTADLTSVYWTAFAGAEKLIEISVGFAIVLLLWRRSQDLCVADMGLPVMKRGFNYIARVILGAIAASVFGWMLTDMAGHYADRNIRYHLDSRAKTIADCLDRGKIRMLSGKPEDINMPEYECLKKHLDSIRHFNPDSRFIYLMGCKNSQVRFLVDSEPENSKDYSPPGQIYPASSPLLLSIFRTGRPFVEGPVSDKWGMWLSGHTAVRESRTGPVLAVLGIDIDARNWQRQVAIHRLAPIMITVLLAMLLIGFFISEQRSWEDKIRIAASEKRYRALFNGGDDAVFVNHIGSDGMPGSFIEVNDMACRRLGYSREELLGLSPEEITAPEYNMAMGRPDTQERVLFETALLRKDGERIPVESNMQRFNLHGLDVAISVARDISERKMLENQLIQSQKLECIGQLAAGIAHEVKSPISFIDTNLSTLDEYRKDLNGLLGEYQRLECLARDETRSGFADLSRTIENVRELREGMDLEFVLSDFENIIAESKDGTERIKGIVTGLKEFSHLEEGETRYTDINKGLESTLRIVWNEIKYKATVVRDYGDIPHVLCYAQEVNQVFMNLLTNAAHAIDGFGEIRMATRLLNGCERVVEVRISDTGKGIKSEELTRIFEPFYTTKPVGEGTGLGLSIVQRIIRKHGGEIGVESAPGKGTTFFVRLPVEGPNQHRKC